MYCKIFFLFKRFFVLQTLPYINNEENNNPKVNAWMELQINYIGENMWKLTQRLTGFIIYQVLVGNYFELDFGFVTSLF